MIPADVASRLRLTLPDQPAPTQPVPVADKIGDVLSNLLPGQRVTAEILAVLPNGAYRALVAQREITLALPFSARSGDSLELEVQENDGQLTLATTLDRNGATAKAIAQESTFTSLSQTGKLISSLVASPPEEGNTHLVSLNSSQALVETMPDSAASLAPILKQAITESGMFYEAHQAKWVAGELSISALRQEPQGKIPTSQPQGNTNDTAAVHGALEAKTASPEFSIAPANDRAAFQTDTSRQNATMPLENVLTIVRQQLDGLANNNFAWQGQIWPGQQMQWEIGEAPEHHKNPESSEQRSWQSRLKLSLPLLGTINATIRLQPGDKITLDIASTSKDSIEHLRTHAEQLTSQFTKADLDLIQLNLRHEPTDK